MGLGMMPFGGAGAGGNVCSFFLKGNCKKGAQCPFSHSLVDPFQAQMQQLMFLQQQQQALQQQLQQQQHYEGGGGSGKQRREKKERPERQERQERAPKEKRALTEAEKEALLSKPLAAGTQSKRFKEDKKPAAPAAVVASAPIANRPGVKKAAPSTGAVQIKTLSQIMAEKNSGKNSEKKTEKKVQQSVDDELLAMGLDPKDLEGFGGGDGDDVDIVI